jgi:hypothetical protein
MSENKKVPNQSWNIGDIRISEWANISSQGKEYSSYQITKTEYEKPQNMGERGTYKQIFSLPLNRKEDILIVKYLLKRRTTEKKVDYASFYINFDPNSKLYILGKTYVNYKTNETANVHASMSVFDIICLEELTDIFIKTELINYYNSQNRQSNNNNNNYGTPSDNGSSSFNDAYDNSGNVNDILEDNIPF